MILVCRRPNAPDAYVGVMTPPHARENLVVPAPITATQFLERAKALGVAESEIRGALEAAAAEHYGGVL